MSDAETHTRFRAAIATELIVSLCFVGVSVWLSWPLAANFSDHIGGENGDPFQTLWSWRWLNDALLGFHNPFHTDRVYFPRGASLVFQTFDLPTALLAVPLWNFLSPLEVYNTGLLWSFWLSAYGMYRLARELTGDRLAALCAGVLFIACPYHIAHATAHLHLASMGWLPLYFLYLTRILSGRGRTRDAVLAGLFLALASLASWYHLLFAAVGTLLLSIQVGVRSWQLLVSKQFAIRASALTATYLLVAGPLLAAILIAKSKRVIAGAHDPREFSGDVLSFFFPNALQSWSDWWGGQASHWTGNSAENALYVGYSVLALALAAPFTRAWRARGWLTVASVGAVLALGPQLHVAGAILEGNLPYAWLQRALPQLEFMGVPVRFGYLLYLGLIVNWTFTIARLRQWAVIRAERHGSRASNALASALLALVPLGLALLEYQPAAFPISEAKQPPPMRAWSHERGRFAVLDLSGKARMMWHATLHRQPMAGGYLTRMPLALDQWYAHLDVVQAIIRPEFVHMVPRLERIDGPIDFAWRNQPPGPRIRPRPYGAQWTGQLTIPRRGRWTFYLSSDDGSRLSIDGSLIVDNAGEHPMQTRLATRTLAQGEHAIDLSYEQLGGDAGVHLEWQGPGLPREVIPRAAFHTARGEPGLVGVYRQGGRKCPLDAATAQADLRALGVRYVVTEDANIECLQHGYALTEIYRDLGIRIWHVPPIDSR